MNDYSLNPINVPSEDFLHAFFEPEDRVCLRVFEDKGDGSFAGQKLECQLEGFSDLTETLERHNNADRGVFFVVNSGGHDDETINRINAQFVEMDDFSFEEQLEKIKAFKLAPSIIVKTQKSLHCYWLMKGGADVKRFRHIQSQLIAHFSGDKKCVNESRVMRIPGFYHRKGEPVPVQCIKFNPELRYTQNQLAAELPEVPDDSEYVKSAEAPMIKERGHQMGLVLMGRKCPFFTYCKRNAKTLPEPDWYAMISNMALFEGGEEAIHKLSKPYPKYSFRQTQSKIDHFHSSGTKPITCKKICEGCFKCPKMGKCPARSPAGFAFFPASLAELKKWLESVKISGDTVSDLQLAHRFIRDYLYNQEPGLAEPFIKYDLKKHFDYKANDVRGLVVAYREMHEQYASSKEVCSKNKSTQEWYEINRNGVLHLMPGVLANHLCDNFHAFHCTEQYYYYQNGVYQPRTDKDAKATVRTYLNPRDVTLNQINDVEGQWQLTIRKPIREINSNPFIINCKNGLYNVLDDSSRVHDPAYYSTVQMKANYDPEAKCPRFTEFLHSALEPPEIHLLQEIFGYFLVPITKAQKSFLLCGLPNVGKSTILTCLQEFLLGAENVSNIPLQSLSDRFQPAELFGKLANIFADLPTKKIDDAGMFKAVTGEDYITGERKHKDPFSFKPFARFLYSCNDIPRNYGDKSEAFYRRLIIIRFSKPVPPEKHDLQLGDKLSLERDGILLWAIEGLKRLIANQYQFTETERTKAELQAYKIENNAVLAFIYEHCALEPDAVSYRKEVYNAFVEYCNANNRGKVSFPNFLKEVANSQRGLVTLADEPITRRAIFKGLKLR